MSESAVIFGAAFYLLSALLAFGFFGEEGGSGWVAIAKSMVWPLIVGWTALTVFREGLMETINGLKW